MGIDDPIFDGQVHVRMSFDASRQAGRTGRIVRDWFDVAWRELGGSMRERVAAAPPATGPVPHGIYLMATVLVPDDEHIFFEYDMSPWESFLDRISTGPFVGASFHAGESGDGAEMLPYYLTDDFWRVTMHRWESQGRDLVQLTVESKEAYLYSDPVGDAAVVAFLDRMLREVDADYAEAGFGYGGLGTVIDSTTYRSTSDSQRRARETLRGYSWLTMMPAPLVLRVGGAAGLRASGAFVAVEELPNGGVLLQATQRFRDFGDAEATRVFEVLRPVLPADARASAFRRKIQARGR